MRASDSYAVDVSVDVPSHIRGGRPTNGTVYITNTGNTNIPVVTYGVLLDNDDRLDLSVPEVHDASADPTSDGTRKVISLITTALRPGETRAVSFTVRASTQFPAHGHFMLGLHATAYSFTDFRDGPLHQVSEAARLGVLLAEDIPDDVRWFAQDEAYWWQVMRDYYDEHGLTGARATRSDENVAVSGDPIDKGVKGTLCGLLGAAGGSAGFGIGGVVIGGICVTIILNDPDDIVENIVEVIQSWDPNEKVGPSGYGEGIFVDSISPLLYHVEFENLPEATAPAAEVYVSDTLEPSLDVPTLRVGRIRFGDTIIEVPSGRASYETTVDLLAEHGVLVNVQAGVDAINRTAFWSLRALDPDTMQLPADPFLGFLPPNDETGRGEGYVEFTIEPNASTLTGTVVTNRASIVFDYNDPIETNEVFNAIDSGPPATSVQAVAEYSMTPFVLRWGGADDEGGAGLSQYQIYVRTDGGPAELWYSGTQTWAHFDGEVGSSYAFYSIGIDNVGNTESLPEPLDATTTVTAIRRPGDIDLDGDTDLDDLAALVACLGTPLGPGIETPSNCADADVNGDRQVDLQDFAVLQSGFGAP